MKKYSAWILEGWGSKLFVPFFKKSDTMYCHHEKEEKKYCLIFLLEEKLQTRKERKREGLESEKSLVKTEDKQEI